MLSLLDLMLFPCIAALNLPLERFGWIGLKDFSGNDTDFRWISDNSSLTFDNWEASQPDNDAEQCVLVGLSPSEIAATGEWFDFNCGFNNPAVCEADRVSGNP